MTMINVAVMRVPLCLSVNWFRLCKIHGSFLPTIMQMKKDDRLRPIEYEGCWESDSTCNVCYQTHGAFIKRCCDVVVCESCFTQYVNHQVSGATL